MATKTEDLIIPVGVVTILGIGAYVFYDDLVNLFSTGKITDVVVNTANVTKPAEVYQSAADQTYSELAESLVYASSDKLLSFLTGLNDDELKQVYTDFGTRADMLDLQELGSKHDLFWWYQNEHGTNPLFDLAALKTRWAGTGLWV